MNLCDLSAVDIILSFAVGGISLRYLIELAKKWLRVVGLGAVLVALVVCFGATAIYLIFIGSFSWLCLVLISFNVFTGTQVAYRATHS